MSDLTNLLEAVARGDPEAAASLWRLVHAELRRLAGDLLADERPGQTLQPTALVHEAFVRLAGGAGEPPRWESRAHFFGCAARAMRQILVDAARRKKAAKHGGGRRRVDLADLPLAAPERGPDLLALDEALTRLAARDPRKAELVQLRYFGGLTLDAAARVLGISDATADRWWAFARAWLYDALTDAEEKNPPP